MRRYLVALADAGSIFEIHPGWARELTVAFGRIDGRVVGFVANNSLHRGGVLFVDSADKATHFIQLCDAFNVPLVFLADVPGFMVGAAVERQGIIRHAGEDDQRGVRGHRSEDLRGGPQGVRRRLVRDGRSRIRAGRHAGPADREDRRDGCRGGGERRVRQQDRGHRRSRRAGWLRATAARGTYEADIDIVHLAAELVVDALVEPEDLRAELSRRLTAAASKDRSFSRRRHGVTPV
jgi:acetyl-CoA carboxylase carboxyltransferase component